MENANMGGQVSFSEHLDDFLQKVNELCTLHGYAALVIVYSPTFEVYTFGQVSADTIIDRFLSEISERPYSSRSDVTALYLDGPQDNARVVELKTRFAYLSGQMKAAKKRAEQLEEMKKVTPTEGLLSKPIDELNRNELMELMAILDDVHKKVVERQAEMALARSTRDPALEVPPQPVESSPSKVGADAIVDGDAISGDFEH